MADFKTSDAARAAGRKYYAKKRTERRAVMARRRRAKGIPVRATARRDPRGYHLRRYGITPAQYDKMLELQGGVCAICSKPPKAKRLHTDHDHATGRVRGLLCFYCNKFKVGRHTAVTAKAILDYLARDFDGRAL